MSHFIVLNRPRVYSNHFTISYASNSHSVLKLYYCSFVLMQRAKTTDCPKHVPSKHNPRTHVYIIFTFTPSLLHFFPFSFLFVLSFYFLPRSQLNSHARLFNWPVTEPQCPFRTQSTTDWPIFYGKFSGWPQIEIKLNSMGCKINC